MKNCQKPRKRRLRRRYRRQKGGIYFNLKKKALNYGKKIAKSTAIGAVDAGLRAAKRGHGFNKIATAAGGDVLKRVGRTAGKAAVNSVMSMVMEGLF